MKTYRLTFESGAMPQRIVIMVRCEDLTLTVKNGVWVAQGSPVQILVGENDRGLLDFVSCEEVTDPLTLYANAQGW